MTVSGMDIEAVRALSRQLDDAAGLLESLGSSLSVSLNSVEWAGPDADTARANWEAHHGPLLAAAGTRLRDGAQALSQQAAEQEMASAERDAISPSEALRAAPTPPLPPPTNATPEDARKWWASLSGSQRTALIGEHPELVGAMDGLPAAARSEANERVLRQTIEQLDARKSQLSPQERLVLENARAVDQRLSDLRSMHDADGNAVVARLLVFDPAYAAGEGRVAISIGDTDTAQNVSVVVPGFSSDVRSYLPSLQHNAWQLYREARFVDRAASTATIMWMGYDAPGLSNVSDDNAAKIGSKLLAADIAGLRTARTDNFNLSLVGHSYGSTTVGLAMKEQGVRPDSAVLIGSPGTSAENAREFGLPEGRVFVGANSRDAVSYFDRFGTDPTHADFEAVRFQAEDPTRSSYRLTISDHSKYFQPGSESLSNIAYAVTGHDQQISRAPYRHEWPILPDGISTDPESRRAPTVRSESM